MAIDPDKDSYQEALSLILSDSSDYASIVNLFEAALKGGLYLKSEAHAYLQMGSIFCKDWSGKNYGKAIECYEKALALESALSDEEGFDAFWIESKFKYGLLLALRDNPRERDIPDEKRIEILNKLIDELDHPLAHKLLGNLYAGNGQYDKAKHHWQYLIDNTSIYKILPAIDDYIAYAKDNLLKLEEIEKIEGRSDNKKFGCFIATAAMGTPLAQEVFILSRFRDQILVNSYLGRCLVKVYYFLSPHVAALIKKNNRLKRITAKYFVKPLAKAVSTLFD